jgi:hypothetical protein
MPATQINRDSPTLPEKEKMAEGVAKMPVPIIRLNIKNIADTTPIWRLASRAWKREPLSMSEGGASGSADAGFASEVAPYLEKGSDIVEEEDMSGVDSILLDVIRILYEIEVPRMLCKA